MAKADLTIEDLSKLTPLALAQNRLAEIQGKEHRDFTLEDNLRRCCELLSIACDHQATSISDKDHEIALLRQRVEEFEGSQSNMESATKKASRGKRAGRRVKAQFVRQQERETGGRSSH